MSNSELTDMTSTETAVLGAQLTNLVNMVGELREEVREIHKQNATLVAKIPVIESNNEHHAKTIERMREKIEILERENNTLNGHFKRWSGGVAVIGLVAGLAAGSVGWGWNRIDNMHTKQYALDQRISMLEYQNGSNGGNRNAN